MILSAGTPAPDVTLKKTPDETLRLSDLRGRPVILAFYPADWSPVCGDELALFNECLPEFERYDAQLVGISVDSVWCHQAYAKARNLAFPLVADFEPKGEVSRKYGAYRAQDGFAERALFVIDGDGRIRWSYLSDVGKNPGADGVLSALEEMSQRQPAGATR
jgi:peroxiredoxin